MLRLYRRFAAPIFWIAILIVYVAAIMPAALAPDFRAGDKFNHMTAFLALTVLGRIAYRRVPAWRLAIGLSLFGILIELTQAIPALHRTADVWDWVADSGAILVGLVIALAFERRWPPARAAA